MNFEKFLVGITIISAICWIIDKILNYKQANNRIMLKNLNQNVGCQVIEYIGSLCIIFAIVLIFRSFLYEGFRIPSGSMKPTLIDGDCVLVNKYIYGLRLPITHKKIFEGSKIKRGDIIVFWNAKSKKNFIKRVIGLPGDHIKYKNHNLYINDVLINNVNMGFAFDDVVKVDLKRELLENIEHEIYLDPLQNRQYPFEDLVVTKDSYFVMGDNRTNSADSRMEGLVADEDIVGKALMIFLSIDFKHKVLRFDRIGRKI